MTNSNSRGNIAVVVIIIVVVLGAIWFFARNPSVETNTPSPVATEKTTEPLTGVDSIEKTGSADEDLDENIGAIDNELINLSADANAALQ